MKIKKKTSLMMIAASTAAVVGVAAVSFAAWNGGRADLTAEAATGHVDMTGFISENYTAPEGTKLYPIDQGESYTTMISFDADYLATEDSTLKVSTDNATLELWIKVGDVTTAPTTKAELTAENSGWQQLTTTATPYGETLAASNEKVETQAHIVLVSSASTDMDQTFTVTLNIAVNE